MQENDNIARNSEGLQVRNTGRYAGILGTGKLISDGLRDTVKTNKLNAESKRKINEINDMNKKL